MAKKSHLFFPVLAILSLLFSTGAFSGQHTFYTTAEDFEAQLIAAHSYTETFDGISGGNLETAQMTFSDNGRSFDASVSGAGNLWGMVNANEGTHGWEGNGLSLQQRASELSFGNFVIGNPVTAIGGWFFGTDDGTTLPNGAFVPGQSVTMTVTFQDASTDSIMITPGDFSESFIGVTADENNPITGFVVGSVPNSFASTSEVTIGVIPEPASAALVVSLILSMLVLMRRRRD